ncbi:cis-prenyltransferase [Lecanora helva]
MPSMHLSQLRRWFLQSPPVDWAILNLRDLLIGALRQGPIPQHVAFVMDGNRRFARTHGIETVEGHNLGFEALARVLEVCYKSGVKVVTVYAFSIENFKRSKYEVDALMEMAKVKLSQLAQHGDLLDRYGASVRVLGQRELLKPDVIDAMDRAVGMTEHNKQAILNVCFPYTSHDEITTAIRDTVVDYSKPLPSQHRSFSESHITHTIRARHLSAATLKVRSHSPSSGATSDTEDSISSSTTLHPDSPPEDTILVEDDDMKIQDQNTYPDPETITAKTLNDHMFTANLPPLDLLIRTSGVERLSDFMLWQCHENTDIFFLKCLWPDFDLWTFLPVLVEWQWKRRKLEERQRGTQSEPEQGLKLKSG